MNLASTQWELCLLPCAGCCPMLRNVEIEVLGGGDCCVTLHVLATDVDAEVGLIICVWSRIGQMARRTTPARSRARVQSGGVSVVVVEEKIGGNAENSRNTQKWHGARMGWFWRDTESLKHLSAGAWDELCEVWHATKTCAHACVWWGVICTCTRMPKQTKCQPTIGPRPTHSGTQGWSEPCVQREPTRRAIFVIVIEQRK